MNSARYSIPAAGIAALLMALQLSSTPATSATNEPEHAGEGVHGEHEGEEAHDHEGETTSFTVADFERYGVTVAAAGAGVVDVAFELPGEIRPNAERIAHLAPRFPGLVLDVRKSIGDTVRKGEVLARIETDNLTAYDLVAGFGGVVLDRHIAVGETATRDSVAFTVADLSTVWAEIHVYQKAFSRVRVGQSVSLASDDGSVRSDGVISYVAPVADPATRTASARVVLDNRDGRWRPGLLILASVNQPVEAKVVVRRRALHTFEDRPVVFVVEGESFAARPVVVGVRGADWVEIERGVEAGERYADQSSFLVKAELGKGAAGHDH